MRSLLEAYKLLHDGAKALAIVESNGIRVDREQFNRCKEEALQKLNDVKAKMQAHEIYKQQRKVFGSSASINNRNQLAVILSNYYNVKLPKTTTGRNKLDDSVLQSLDLDYAKLFIQHEKYSKLINTYIANIEKEIAGNFIHPVFNLHLVTTYRSSCDSPNFQNIPIRDPEIARLIRTPLVPRENHVLIEVDYSALEFRVAASVWEDPIMIDYASNPELDIHRDCAALLFKLKKSDVSKKARYCAKNLFVFPILYGDFYVDCAKNLWEAIEKHKLEVNNCSLYEHLRKNGITARGVCDPTSMPVPGTYEHHVKDCEEKFFNKFHVLKENQLRRWKEYKETGYYKLVTGFIIKGVYKRTFFLNSNIQGPAFHLLLQSLIDVVKWTLSNKTRTKIIAQIHDSILADVHVSEVDDFLSTIKTIMTETTPMKHDWLRVPLDIEAELCEKNWHEKKPVKL